MASLLIQSFLLTALLATSVLCAGTREGWGSDYWGTTPDKPIDPSSSATETPTHTMGTNADVSETTRSTPPWWWMSTTEQTPNTTTYWWWPQTTTDKPMTPSWWWGDTSTRRPTTVSWWWPQETTTPSWWWGDNSTMRTTTTRRWWPQETTTPSWWWGDNSTMSTTTTRRWWPQETTTPSWWWGDTSTKSTTTTPRWWTQTTTRRPTMATTEGPWWTTRTPQTTNPTTTSFPINATVVPQYARERECACDASKLYLDIVVVVDSSLSMGKEGLIEVAATLVTLFQPMNISSGTYNGQFVRVGLVTFAKEAVIVAGLDKFSTYDELLEGLFRMPYHRDNKLNIEAGLQMASSVLMGSRDYARKVVLLYSSAYSVGGFLDPKAIANQMKESGTTIATVAFRQQPEGDLVKRLGAIATPLFSFGSKDNAQLISSITHAFCQANCFCKDNWMQYTTNFYNPVYKHGECVRFMDIDASWTAASYACRAMANGAHLVNEFTIHKQGFIKTLVSSGATTENYEGWHIGLKYDRSTSQYHWQGPNGAQIPFDSTVGDRIPKPPAENGDCFFEARWWHNAQPLSESCYTEPKRYVCEIAACDTDNFCVSTDE